MTYAHCETPWDFASTSLSALIPSGVGAFLRSLDFVRKVHTLKTSKFLCKEEFSWVEVVLEEALPEVVEEAVAEEVWAAHQVADVPVYGVD